MIYKQKEPIQVADGNNAMAIARALVDEEYDVAIVIADGYYTIRYCFKGNDSFMTYEDYLEEAKETE